MDVAAKSLVETRLDFSKDLPLLPRSLRVSWNLGGAWLLREAHEFCDPTQNPCGNDNMHVVVLLIGLCAALVMSICAFAFFRDGQEEDITPLCPQLIVNDSDLNFTVPIDLQAEGMTITIPCKGQFLCKVVVEWPDPLKGTSGMAAHVKLLSSLDHILATVVARNVSMVGQGLALCRQGVEIFGFVEPDGPQRYLVRHRTGVHLLTLEGDFGSSTSSAEIRGINPVGSQVCWFKQSSGECRVLQNVDAGLVICSLLATYVHKRLLSGVKMPSTVPVLATQEPEPA